MSADMSIVPKPAASSSPESERKIGSLLRLFRSEFFDLWMCVVYLQKYQTHRGVYNYLCHELYKFPQEEVEFYLPQLVFGLLFFEATDKEALERYILDRCSKSMHFALRTTFLLSSYEIHLQTVPQKELCARLKDSVEIFCVNMGPPGRTTSNSDISVSFTVKCRMHPCRFAVDVGSAVGKSTCDDGCDHVVSVSLDCVTIASEADVLMKARRSEFFVNENTCLLFLVDLSSRLREVPLPERTPALQKQLVQLNSILPKGLYVPLTVSSRPFLEILRFVPEYSFVLKSKERCPFMTFVEVRRHRTACSEPPLSLHGSDGQTAQQKQHEQKTNQAFETNVHDITSAGISSNSSKRLSRSLSDPTGAQRGSNFSLSVSSSNLEQLLYVRNPPTAVLQNPQVGPFIEIFADRKERIRATSPFSEDPDWDLLSFIVKANDDIRQEELAQQLIRQFALIFANADLTLWLRPYHVISVSGDAGFVETILDAVSIDVLKKSIPNFVSLKQYFCDVYGVGMNLRQAQRNFVESMAAYSIVCYLLQVKDRHNGNIMMDKEGHVIHIDFGFMLSRSPGSINFEGEGFKLSAEFVELMDGTESDLFNYFRALILRGFLECRKHMDRIASVVELMVPDRTMPCFSKDGGQQTVQELRERFKLGLTEAAFLEFVNGLIDESCDNWRSRQYDNFQRLTNGIL
jgi:phosphatidylinositol 4-kinase